MRLERVPAGVALVREGQRAHVFIHLLAGAAAVERDGVRIGSLRGGDFFGEIALLTYTSRTATVTTTEPSAVLVVPEDEFRALVDDEPGFGRRVFAAAAARSF